ncbi:MAG: DUF4830 domain-containing protein [Oscillospiraceae bacterium]|nr:DUF4830 domain-containing protein [Oscillospiraceae bacterium]
MIIVTAKLNRKKALAVVLAITVVITAIILLAGRRDQSPEGPGTAEIPVETAADIVTFLEYLGWQVSPDPIDIREILIPREWGQVYEAYNALQIEAGFDLTAHRGRPAMRHTYEILNHPDQVEGVVADVLVANGQIIGGGIQSIHLDGFIHGLFPNPVT